MRRRMRRSRCFPFLEPTREVYTGSGRGVRSRGGALAAQCRRALRGRAAVVAHGGRIHALGFRVTADGGGAGLAGDALVAHRHRMPAGGIDIIAAGHRVLARPTVLDRIAARIHTVGRSRSDLRLVVLRRALLLVVRECRAEGNAREQGRGQQRHAQACTHARTGRHHAVRASRELRGHHQHAKGRVPHLAVNPVHGSRPSFCVFGGIRQPPGLAARRCEADCVSETDCAACDRGGAWPARTEQWNREIGAGSVARNATQGRAAVHAKDAASRCCRKDVQAEPQCAIPRRKTLPAFPIPLARDDAKTTPCHRTLPVRCAICERFATFDATRRKTLKTRR